MRDAGFKTLARCLGVGHAHVWPVRWNCEVEVFGCKVQPGQLIHADKHGFLAVPPEDVKGLYEASLFMDGNECDTVIAAATSAHGKTKEEFLEAMSKASAQFRENTLNKFGKKGEW